MDEAVDLLARAITDEGPVPMYHRIVMDRARKEWPTLWHAIDRILAARVRHNGAPTR